MIDDPLLAPVKSEPVDIPSKKVKVLDEYNNAQIDLQRHLMFFRQQQLPFIPWPIPPPPGAATSLTTLPYSLPQFSSEQFTEPPVLQNPERVVRLSESQRFESSFQPNVALAPRKQIKEKEQTREQQPPRPPSGVIAVIKQEPEIKEEPPSTPPDVIQSPEPRYSPANGILNATSTATSAASPEISQSGSNEITSSTSPVPAINNTSESNNQLNVVSKQESVSPTPPPVGGRKTESTDSIHHRSQVSPVVHKNGTCPVTTHGSELELSTDTDDESLAGEPDSSCVTFDLAGDILKDVRPEQRDKLLNFVKMLIQESSQAKQFRADNEQLRLQLQNRDEQIEQLIQKNELLRKQLEQYESHQAEAKVAVTQHQQIQSSVIARPETTNSNFETTKLVEHRNGFTDKSTSEYIIKPLKKSLRRSPEDTVVIMQPKRDEIKIVTNGELVRSVN